MHRRLTIDAPILARRINTFSSSLLSPASLVTLTAAVTRAAAAPLYVARLPSAPTSVSHSPGASLVRLLDALGEATGGRGLGPLAVARLFSDAAGVLADVRGPEALRVFFSAAGAFERTFATLRAELISEQLCDESNTPATLEKNSNNNNNNNNINNSNSHAHSVGAHLSRLTVAYATFLARASPVVGAAQVEAAADPLIESLFSAGIWPQREVIFALLDVSVACHRPAAVVRLACAIPILYSVQQQTAASSIKPMEALVDSIIYARNGTPISQQGATDRATQAALTFGWSRADVFEVGTMHAPLMSAARALGTEPCDAHDALSIIVSFISEFTANRSGDIAFSTATNYSTAESSTDVHTAHSHSELVENCLTLALRLITTYSDVDINGELALQTLQARLKLAALRNWYSQRPAALDASLGRGTRADIARVFTALANEQLKNTNIPSARKLQRQVTGISFWRSGAIGACSAVNTAADAFLLESFSRCDDTVTPTNITSATTTMADMTARAASVISSLKILGVHPSLDVGTRVMRIALASNEPALLKNLLSAMGGNIASGLENVISLSEASAARVIAMLDDALSSSLDKTRAALTLVSMLDDLTAVGAIPSSAFLTRILTLAKLPLNVTTQLLLPFPSVASSSKQSAAAVPLPLPLPLPSPSPSLSLPIPLPSTDSVSSLLSEVSMRLAGVLPSSVMSIPSWRGIPLVLPRAYGGGLSGVILNFPSVLLEVPISLALLLSLDATGAEAATANTALGNAVNQTLERMPWSAALDLMSNTLHENTLRTLSIGLEPQDSLLLGLRMHANHGSIVRVHAPVGAANVTPVAPDHVLMALHLTVPTDLPARPGTRLVPGDSNFNAILVSAAAVLIKSQKLSFRKPRQRGTPRLDEWWHCRIRPLPVGGEEPTPGVSTLPPDWKVDVSPVQRETVIAGLRDRYNADLDLKKMKSKINP